MNHDTLPALFDEGSLPEANCFGDAAAAQMERMVLDFGRMYQERNEALQEVAHGRGAPLDDQLMFAGHNVYRFRDDPFYANGFVPTVKQLVQRILTGH